MIKVKQNQLGDEKEKAWRRKKRKEEKRSKRRKTKQRKKEIKQRKKENKAKTDTFSLTYKLLGFL